MKPPKKRIAIYEDLKKQIEAGAYAPGSALPQERELVIRYGVALETLRSAMKLLVDDGLITRMRGQGTYVKDPPVASDRTITFLIPCPNFLFWHFSGSLMFRDMITGCMETCFERRIRMETLPVSPTNRMDDIEWSRLCGLTEKSSVIVCSWWFEPLFPFLLNRGCRVASLLTEEALTNAEWSEKLRDWRICYLNERRILQDALVYFRSRGCRRSALASQYLHGRGNLYPEEFRRLSSGTPEELESRMLDIRERLEGEELRAVFREWWERERFDSLFLSLDFYPNYQYSLNENLGLPEEVCVILSKSHEYDLRLRPQVSSFSCPWREIGRTMALALTEETVPPGVEQYYASLVERN